MNPWANLISSILDGLLLGIPSSIAQNELASQYEMELADVRRLYNEVKKQYNIAAQAVTDSENDEARKNEIRDMLYSSMQEAGPIGQIAATLRDKYFKAKEDAEEAAKTTKAARQKALAAENRMLDAESDLETKIAAEAKETSLMSGVNKALGTNW